MVMSKWVNISEQGKPTEAHSVIDCFIEGEIHHALYFAGYNFYTKEGRPIPIAKISHYRLPDNTPPEIRADKTIKAILEDPCGVYEPTIKEYLRQEEELCPDKAFYYYGREIKVREEAREELRNVFREMSLQQTKPDLTKMNVEYPDYFLIAEQMLNIELIELGGSQSVVWSKRAWDKKRKQHGSNNKQ